MLSHETSFTVADLLSRLNVAMMDTSEVAEVRMGACSGAVEGIFTYNETLDLLQELLDEGLVDIDYS